MSRIYKPFVCILLFFMVACAKTDTPVGKDSQSLAIKPEEVASATATLADIVVGVVEGEIATEDEEVAETTGSISFIIKQVMKQENPSLSSVITHTVETAVLPAVSATHSVGFLPIVVVQAEVSNEVKEEVILQETGESSVPFVTNIASNEIIPIPSQPIVDNSVNVTIGYHDNRHDDEEEGNDRDRDEEHDDDHDHDEDHGKKDDDD